MIEIPLTKGYVAIIDDIDAEFAAFRWAFSQGYAIRSRYSLHRQIVEKAVGRKLSRQEVVDHINRNKLDNRRENLRVVSHSVNAMNRDYVKKGASGVKGVTYLKSSNKWRATVYCDGIYKLGIFNTKEEAIEAYNKAAAIIFEEYWKGVPPHVPTT